MTQRATPTPACTSPRISAGALVDVRAWAVACVLLGLGACGGAAIQAQATPPIPASEHTPAAVSTIGGHLVLIGYGDKPPSVMERFIELAGSISGRIVVRPLARRDRRDTGAYYQGLLASYGASNDIVIHLDTWSDALCLKDIDVLSEVAGVFFSGGDQRRIVERLVGAPMYDALRALMARGDVIGGTSADTAGKSVIMLTDDGYATVLAADSLAVAPGLGVLADLRTRKAVAP